MVVDKYWLKKLVSRRLSIVLVKLGEMSLFVKGSFDPCTSYHSYKHPERHVKYEL
jgi:hypothetical protein